MQSISPINKIVNVFTLLYSVREINNLSCYSVTCSHCVTQWLTITSCLKDVAIVNISLSCDMIYMYLLKSSFLFFFFQIFPEYHTTLVSTITKLLFNLATTIILHN